MKKNKGFTLVEVIVILVILAILAAILVPALTTYIDKAKEKTVAAEARSALIAAQAWASEQYAVKGSSISGTYDNEELEEYAEDWSGSVDQFYVDYRGHVYGLVYCGNNGITLYHYSDGTWSKNPPEEPVSPPTDPADDDAGDETP